MPTLTDLNQLKAQYAEVRQAITRNIHDLDRVAKPFAIADEPWFKPSAEFFNALGAIDKAAHDLADNIAELERLTHQAC